MIAVDPNDMIGLVNATERNDLLGLHAIARSRGVDAHSLRTAGGYDEHMDAILTGRTPAGRDAIAEVVTTAAQFENQPLLDAIACDLLLDAGLDPAALCAIALQLDGAVSFRRDGAMLAVVHAPEDEVLDTTCTVAIHVGGGAALNTLGSVVISGHPATVLAALAGLPEGRPLRDLVTHPVLDRYNIVLGACEAHSDRAVIEAAWTRTHLSPAEVLERVPPAD